MRLRKKCPNLILFTLFWAPSGYWEFQLFPAALGFFQLLIYFIPSSLRTDPFAWKVLLATHSLFLPKTIHPSQWT